MLDEDETDVKASKGTGKDVESELGVGEKELKWLAGQGMLIVPTVESWFKFRLVPSSAHSLVCVLLLWTAATRSPLWLFLRLFPGSSAQLLDKSNLASDSALLQKYSKLG